jgi:hypothetical protein
LIGAPAPMSRARILNISVRVLDPANTAVDLEGAIDLQNSLVITRSRLREGATTEILVVAPDSVGIQLQDISYCGGRGALGNMCD